jgi:hypothetical protein
MKSFKDYIIEKQIENVKHKKIEIDLSNLSLQSTKHSEERQETRGIKQEEVISTINKAIPMIVSDIANGEIARNESVWIFNSKTKLNVIAGLDFKKGLDFLSVITTIRKENFKPKNKTDKKYKV